MRLFLFVALFVTAISQSLRGGCGPVAHNGWYYSDCSKNITISEVIEATQITDDS